MPYALAASDGAAWELRVGGDRYCAESSSACSDVGEPCSEDEFCCVDRLRVEGTCQPRL